MSQALFTQEIHILFYVYGWVFSLGIRLCATGKQYQWRPEEGIRTPGSEVGDACEPSGRCWESNTGTAARALTASNC